MDKGCIVRLSDKESDIFEKRYECKVNISLNYSFG